MTVDLRVLKTEEYPSRDALRHALERYLGGIARCQDGQKDPTELLVQLPGASRVVFPFSEQGRMIALHPELEFRVVNSFALIVFTFDQQDEYTLAVGRGFACVCAHRWGNGTVEGDIT